MKQKTKKSASLGKLNHTSRGFELVEFTDSYDVKCSIQESSSAEGRKLWLGVDDVDPQILRMDAGKLGLEGGTTHPDGWMSYPVPTEVLLHSRMHLDEEQVRGLVAHLQAWLKNDSIET